MVKKTKFNFTSQKKVDWYNVGWHRVRSRMKKHSPCYGQNSQLVHPWVLVRSSHLNKYFALVFLRVVVEITFQIIMIIIATLVLFWKIQCLPKTESANDQEATYSSIKNYIRRHLGISEGSPVASQEHF
jgi:hypothetical protein